MLQPQPPVDSPPANPELPVLQFRSLLVATFEFTFQQSFVHSAAHDETIIPKTVLGLTLGVVGFQHRTPLSLHHARLSLRQAALLVGMMS